MCLEKSKIEAVNEILNEVKPSKSLHKNAEAYRELYYLSKLIEEKMAEIKPILIEAKIEEYFESDKVVYQEGAEKSFLDNKEVIKIISQKRFNEIATITETALKKEENGEEAIAVSKVVLKERNNPSIKVSKFTKDDKIMLAERRK